eukprot:CAMPEP_0171323288 /NCGR_PEP_ID=MMETSP0816-20121228/115483_1 /TAXON_ID=420281 /ORGANISM="Proboscia inermis, Strain CCAP1064/1" /LENGTH=300 /DNA_ID=CAMNT_0011821965 /DNA_START=80 /DNA_END=982 /DNA_ORIENTATION=-
MTGCSGTALLLQSSADPTVAMLGAGNIALYAGLYTFLKPRSEMNTWVGAVVGAIPPVMGWTAAGGSPFDIESILLGSTLFLWQFPHFFALNWMHRVDYSRGGFKMISCNDPNGDRTANVIMKYAIYLSAIPFVSSALDVTSSMFAVEGILLNGYALVVAKKFYDERSNGNARKVFLTSLWYLPSLLMLFILHSKTWDKDNDKVEDGHLRTALLDTIISVKNFGRERCLHEVIIHHDNEEITLDDGNILTIIRAKESTREKCPLVIGKETVQQVAADSVIAIKGVENENENNVFSDPNSRS